MTSMLQLHLDDIIDRSNDVLPQNTSHTGQTLLNRLNRGATSETLWVQVQKRTRRMAIPEVEQVRDDPMRPHSNDGV